MMVSVLLLLLVIICIMVIEARVKDSGRITTD